MPKHICKRESLWLCLYLFVHVHTVKDRVGVTPANTQKHWTLYKYHSLLDTVFLPKFWRAVSSLNAPFLCAFRVNRIIGFKAAFIGLTSISLQMNGYLTFYLSLLSFNHIEICFRTYKFTVPRVKRLRKF